MNREELKKFLYYDPETGFLIRLAAKIHFGEFARGE